MCLPHISVNYKLQQEINEGVVLQEREVNFGPLLEDDDQFKVDVIMVEFEGSLEDMHYEATLTGEGLHSILSYSTL
jgi:hypothetical protein